MVDCQSNEAWDVWCPIQIMPFRDVCRRYCYLLLQTVVCVNLYSTPANLHHNISEGSFRKNASRRILVKFQKSRRLEFFISARRNMSLVRHLGKSRICHLLWYYWSHRAYENCINRLKDKSMYPSAKKLKNNEGVLKVRYGRKLSPVKRIEKNMLILCTNSWCCPLRCLFHCTESKSRSTPPCDWPNRTNYNTYKYDRKAPFESVRLGCCCFFLIRYDKQS